MDYTVDYSNIFVSVKNKGKKIRNVYGMLWFIQSNKISC